MFEATDTAHAPWYVVDADIKKHARLNCITHLLSKIPYGEVPFEAPTLPKRQGKRDYKPADYEYHKVPKKF